MIKTKTQYLQELKIFTGKDPQRRCMWSIYVEPAQDGCGIFLYATNAAIAVRICDESGFCDKPRQQIKTDFDFGCLKKNIAINDDSFLIENEYANSFLRLADLFEGKRYPVFSGDFCVDAAFIGLCAHLNNGKQTVIKIFSANGNNNDKLFIDLPDKPYMSVALMGIRL
ncbi:MAG: hypothetical protein LBU09_02260 [Endomicrobium sp.]|jgi:hypothetical protein|nr:hypothetical protein [Endomicrobium sp.]